tara:strand:- start:71 stop:283 length:213 start_codon:yes stop_codon:yes gene_type:complete
MTIKKSLNGEIVDMTAEEETKFLQDQENAQTQLAERQASEQTKIDTKASAKAKLIAGEALTEDEANTIVL